MSSLPRYYDWVRSPHPWRQSIPGQYTEGVAYISGRNHLIRTDGHEFRSLDAHGPDHGGDFECRTHAYSEGSNWAIAKDVNNTLSYPTIRGDFGSSYQGDFVAFDSDVSWDSDVWPVVNPSTDIQLYAMGTSVIAHVLPTNPVADLAQFLGELREGLPRLGIDTFKARTARARSAGSDYLNAQFGWKPLLSDIRKFSKAVTQQDKILRQYEKDSGKPVKRKVTMTDDESVSMDTYRAKPSPDVWFWISTSIDPGVMIKTTTVKTRRWFSGVFTYYLGPDEKGSLLSKVWSQKANKLFGTRLTPELVWNLTPWSWAFDWVGNTGDVLHNISAFHNDGLVMPYAYIMEEKSISCKYELKGVTFFRADSPVGIGPYNFEQVFTTTVKKRLAATPFGFGLSPLLDFSNRQLAIIAALGLSRRRAH